MSHIVETTDSLLHFVPMLASYKHKRNSIETESRCFALCYAFHRCCGSSGIANCLK